MITPYISVIIPVFNADAFVEKAIMSAVNQPETAEVIVIDDGSIDNSLAICRYLEQKHPKINVLTHSNNANLGVSASRNLGLAYAKQEYISFLDADDYYLPDRFKCTIKKFIANTNILGVYSGHRIEKLGCSHFQKGKMQSQILPKQLFHFLITNQEYFFIVDLTLRKSKIPKGLFFDEKINFGEDTDFILELCLSGSLIPCKLNKPVLSRVIHQNNTIHNIEKERKGKFLFNQKWIQKAILNNWPKTINRRFVLNLLESKYGHISNKKHRILAKTIYLCCFLLKNPKLFIRIL